MLYKIRHTLTAPINKFYLLNGTITPPKSLQIVILPFLHGQCTILSKQDTWLNKNLCKSGSCLKHFIALNITILQIMFVLDYVNINFFSKMYMYSKTNCNTFKYILISLSLNEHITLSFLYATMCTQSV